MSLTIVDFITKNNRVPLLNCNEDPWTYKGWLAFYVQQLHEFNNFNFPDRWGYLTKIQFTKKITAPIPQINFGIPSEEAMHNFKQCTEVVWKSHGGWLGLRLFLEWLGYGLGIHPELPDMNHDTHQKLYQLFNAALWMQSPHDYIGKYICEQRGNSWNPGAFYPTPHPVCEAMAQMQVVDQTKDNQYTHLLNSVCDPCVGTGRLLLHASNYSLCLFGADIDSLLVLATKINGAIYAPWMVAPLSSETIEAIQKNMKDET